MVQHNSFDSPATAGSQPEPRAKKGGAMIALLVLLTVANTFTLVVAVAGWVDEVDHGGDWGDGVLPLLVFMALVSLVALVGLVGAWLTRKWGPRLYVLTAGFSQLVGLLVSEGAGFTPLNLVGIAFAVALWLKAESSW